MDHTDLSIRDDAALDPDNPITPLQDDDDDDDDDSHLDETADSPAIGNPSAAVPAVGTQPTTPPIVVPPGQSVFSNPPSLGLIRQRLFEVEDVIEFSAPDFERYWPFIDNVWLRNRAAATSKDASTVTEWYQCRLRKASDRPQYVPKPTAEGKVGRKKRARDNVSCEMTLRVVRIEGASQSYRIIRGCGKDARHSHNLDYVDGVKRNSGIMNTARAEGIKGYQPSSTYHRMWAEPDRMVEAGGKFLKISDCRNVTMSWRTENPAVVLKVHDGFASKVSTGPRAKRNSLTPAAVASRTAAASYETATPTKLAAAPSTLPQDTLQYPSHARDFLDPYLPSQARAISRSTPHVTLTYASSLDARIALAPGLRTVLSGPEAKAMTHYLRYRHDAILIGVGTAMADNPALNCRLESAGGYGGKGWMHQPRPVIVDPHARLPIHPDMRMLQMAKEGKAKAPWIIIASNTTPHQDAVRTLKAHYGEYIKLHYGYHPSEAAGFDWSAIFGILHSEGIKSVMVEGGARVLGQLLSTHYARLVDSVIVTVAATFLGRAGVPVVLDSRYDNQGQPIGTRLREIKWQPMGQEDVIMCGKLASSDQQPQHPQLQQQHQHQLQHQPHQPQHPLQHPHQPQLQHHPRHQHQQHRSSATTANPSPNNHGLLDGIQDFSSSSQAGVANGPVAGAQAGGIMGPNAH